MNTQATQTSGTTPNTSPRSMAATVLFTMVMPGLGHVYCGRLIAGLAWAMLSVIAAVGVLIAMASATDAVISAASALLFAVSIGSLAHAVVICQGCRDSYALKQCNHWAVYIMVLMIGTVGVTGAVLQARDNYIEAFKVPARSMFPSIRQGDRVLADKRAYEKAPPQAGDIIIFRNPADPKMTFVKRVVATAGQTVEIRTGQLIIDSRPVEQNAIQLESAPRWLDGSQHRVVEEAVGGRTWPVVIGSGDAQTMADYPATVVPDHCVFVLGDNRVASKDSRHFGPVAWAGVVGKVTTTYWPVSSWGRTGE